MSWNTALTRAFPCRLPIVAAPMAGVSGGLLGARAAKAGALGFVSTGYFQNMDFCHEQIEIFQTNSDKNAPLCLGFVGHAALGTDQGWRDYEKVLEKYRPAVVQFFAPSIVERHSEKSDSILMNNVDLAHKYGALFMAQVGSVQEAQQALDADVDGLMAQGSEAGGHGLRQGSGTLPLASQVKRLAEKMNKSIPVVAAGGIVNGRGVAAALAVCDGAVLGTRLWATEESIGNKLLQNVLIGKNATSCDDVVRTTVFDQIENNFLTTPWPEPFDSVGVLRNETSEKWDGRPDLLAEAITSNTSLLLEEYKKAQKESNAKIVKTLAGEGVGEIDTIHESTHDIILRIEQETKDTLQRMSQIVVD